MSDYEDTQFIEQTVHGYFAVEPDPVFVERLERQLLDQADSAARPETIRPNDWARLKTIIRRHRWATATTAMLLALMVMVMALGGPQQVLAQIQRLLGYAPGIGFVDLTRSRMLATPVAVTRGETTLRVEQILAQPERTLIVISSDGDLPESRRSPGEETDFQALLRFPDGATLSPHEWSLRLGSGTLEFPPLPVQVTEFTLEVSRLPLVQPGAAPEAWRIPLSLRPATQDLVVNRLPQSYRPSQASDTHDGISLRVVEVAHSPEETVMRLQIRWADPTWETQAIYGDTLPGLVDDLGHLYANIPPSNVGQMTQGTTKELRHTLDEPDAAPSPTPTQPTTEVTQAFPPVSPSAHELTLRVDSLQFQLPVEAGFTLDLGDDPQVGDYWPLDVDLMAAGFPIHLSGVRLTRQEIPSPVPQERLALEFDLDPVEEQANRALRGLSLDGSAAGFRGSSSGYNAADGLEAGIATDRATLPTGPIRVGVKGATVLIRNPWRMTWTIPETHRPAETGPAPRTIHPEQVSQTDHDLTLRVAEVILTDRLTAVRVAVEPLPGRLTFDRISQRDLATHEAGLFLSDEQGRRYGRSYFTYWQPNTQAPISKIRQISQTLHFEPIPPTTERLTLRIPAIEARIPASKTFEMAVPPGLTVWPRPDTPPASDPWPVDIPLTMGDYRLRFNKAQLHELNGTMMVTLTSTPFNARQGNRRLTGLLPASVMAPDGQIVAQAHNFSSVYPVEKGDSLSEAQLTFAALVSDQADFVQPGRYRVQLEGATIAIGGPWMLSWDLDKASPRK